MGVGIAIWGIWSQRSIARKRAAIDVFIKTEMDEKMTEAYDKFHAGLDKMRNAKSVEEFCTAEALRPDYLAIRKYLNVHSARFRRHPKKGLGRDRVQCVLGRRVYQRISRRKAGARLRSQ